MVLAIRKSPPQNNRLFWGLIAPRHRNSECYSELGHVHRGLRWWCEPIRHHPGELNTMTLLDSESRCKDWHHLVGSSLFRGHSLSQTVGWPSLCPTVAVCMTGCQRSQYSLPLLQSLSNGGGGFVSRQSQQVLVRLGFEAFKAK